MSAPSDRLAELIQKHLDGQAAPAELVELGEALRAEPELAAEVFRSARLQLALPPVLEAGPAASADAHRAAVEGGGLKVGGLESPVAAAPSTIHLPPVFAPLELRRGKPSTAPTPQPPTSNPQPSSARSSLRARLSWIAIGAAAAVILVVSGLHVLGVLPTRYTTIAIINLGNEDRTERLYDGTVVTAAPGAKAEARGADDARKVRQLIVLREGQIEVKAPKAAPGEVACRVETPEGLWVETVGTVFKVARAWENDKGERNVDRSRLTGAAIAAVLLVAVSDGEVRTGQGLAEEARVVAGGDTVVKAADVPKAGEKIAWGRAVNGLQAGLSIKQARFEAGKPGDKPLMMKFTLYIRNTGDEARQVFTTAKVPHDWCLFLTPLSGGDTIEGRSYDATPARSPFDKEPIFKGQQIELQYEVGSLLKGQYGSYEKVGFGLPKPGKYRVAAKYDVDGPDADRKWVGGELGTIITGSVEIEIVAPAAVPDESATPAEAERIKALIKQLGDADFAAREKATQELIAIGRKALPFLQEAAKSSDAEVAQRARRIIAAIPPPAPAFSLAVEKDGFATITVVAKGLAAEALGRELAKEAAKHVGAEGPSDLRVTIRAAANDSYRAVQSAMLECVKAKVWRVSLEIPGQKPADAPLAKDPGPNGIAQQIRQLDQLVVHVSADDDDPEKPLFRIRLWKSRSPAELAARLKQLRQVGEMPVVIAGDPGCPFRHVMSALDACSEAKMPKVEFQAPQLGSGSSADPGAR